MTSSSFSALFTKYDRSIMEEPLKMDCRSKCAVLGCEQSGGISTFCFPQKNPQLCRKWVKATGRPANWQPKMARICAQHFREKDFKLRSGPDVPRLKQNVVPTVNLPQLNLLQQAFVSVDDSNCFKKGEINLSALIAEEVEWEENEQMPESDPLSLDNIYINYADNPEMSEGLALNSSSNCENVNIVHCSCCKVEKEHSYSSHEAKCSAEKKLKFLTNQLEEFQRKVECLQKAKWREMKKRQKVTNLLIQFTNRVDQIGREALKEEWEAEKYKRKKNINILKNAKLLKGDIENIKKELRNERCRGNNK